MKLIDEKSEGGLSIPISDELSQIDNNVMEMLGATMGTREQKNKLYMQIKTLCNAARVEAFNRRLEIGLRVKENE